MEKSVILNPLKIELSFYLMIATLTTLFLFYIDEGYYSFAWMAEPGAWIIFSFYIAIFLGILLLTSKFFFKQQTGMKKALLILFIGLPIGLSVLLGFMYSIGFLFFN